jgi:hypothetical protein
LKSERRLSRLGTEGVALLFDGDDVICVSILPARRVWLCAMQRPRSRSGSATLHSTSINGYSMRGQRIYIGRQLMASQRNDGRKSPPDILASSRAARCGCFPPSLDHASIFPVISKSYNLLRHQLPMTLTDSTVTGRRTVFCRIPIHAQPDPFWSRISFNLLDRECGSGASYLPDR